MTTLQATAAIIISNSNNNRNYFGTCQLVRKHPTHTQHTHSHTHTHIPTQREWKVIAFKCVYIKPKCSRCQVRHFGQPLGLIAATMCVCVLSVCVVSIKDNYYYTCNATINGIINASAHAQHRATFSGLHNFRKDEQNINRQTDRQSDYIAWLVLSSTQALSL